MDVKYSETVLQAFIAGAPELKKLTELLEDHIGKVKIQAECADGFSRKFGTVDDLVNYENPKSKEIRRVSLSTGLRHLDSEFAEIRLPSAEGISIEFKASEDVVTKLREDTVDILEGMRPWYNILAICNRRVAILIAPLILSLAAWSVDSWLYEFSSKIGISGLYIGLFTIIPAVVFLGHKLCNFLIPWQVFMIGQGKSRFKVKERIQWGVVISSLVSLATGLIIWLITR